MIIRWWDTRIQNYPTTASKMKSINCSAWPFLYFLFTADGWNFCDTSLSPWTKNTFLFFKILICYWDTGIQICLACACKILGVARKRRVPAEKCSYRSTKKANVFKAKRLIEKGVPATSTGALISSADNSWSLSLPFHTALKTPQPNVITLYEHTQMTNTHTHTLTHSFTHTYTHRHV